MTKVYSVELTKKEMLGYMDLVVCVGGFVGRETLLKKKEMTTMAIKINQALCPALYESRKRKIKK